MSLLEVLARAQTTPAPALPFPDFLRRETTHLSWGATVVVITGAESEPLYDTLVYLRNAGFAIALILVMPPGPRRSVAFPGKLPVYRVWREAELEALA